MMVSEVVIVESAGYQNSYPMSAVLSPVRRCRWPSTKAAPVSTSKTKVTSTTETTASTGSSLT